MPPVNTTKMGVQNKLETISYLQKEFSSLKTEFTDIKSHISTVELLAKSLEKRYLAAQFRQIKRSLAEQFHQIKRSLAEQ